MSNLNLDTVSPSQASKEATINLAIAELEAAMTESVTYDLTTSRSALLIDEQRATRLRCTGVPTGGSTLTLLPVKRALIIANAGTGILTVAMGSTTVTVAAGIKQQVYCDGTTNGLELVGGAASTGGGGGGGGGTGGVISADHWRLRLTSTASNTYSLAEVAMRLTVGGTVIEPSSATATSEYGSGDVVGYLFDNNASTKWSSVITSTPQNIDMVFAAPHSFAEVVLTARNDTNNNPTGYEIYYSLDGGATYTQITSGSLSLASGASVTKTIQNVQAGLAGLPDVNVTEGSGIDGKFLKWDNATSKWIAATPASGGGGGGGTTSGTIPPYKRWRLSNFYAQQINSSVAAAEIQLRATPGGAAQIPSSAIATPNYSGYPPANAYDSNTGTFWSANDGNFYNYIEYVYTTAVTVQEIAWTARNDSYFYQSALEFDVEGSNDGINYTFIGRCRTGTNYTTGSTQTFAVPTTVQAAISDTHYARAADIVIPTASQFTFAGSGSNGSVADTTRGMYLKLAATLANAQQAFCYAAMPSTPYTVKMLAQMIGIPGRFNTVGLAFSESSGKHISFNLGGSDDKNSYSVQKFNSLGSFNSSSAYYAWASTPSANVPTWLKVQDDGTNLAFFGSTDGEHWFAITSVSRTVFNTPTLVGPILSLGLPDSTGADIGMKVLSYQTYAGLV